MVTDMFQLVVAITFATFLSHVSLLMLLGRHEELYRGVDVLTNRMADMSFSEPEGRTIPQPMPAGHECYGAPVNWQNPTVQRAQQKAQQKAQQCFTSNYYF